jgi:hypothetical protein
MISKLFTKQFLTIIILSIISLVTFNIYKNEFGLFGNKQNKDIRIYASEKTSKHLLSFNYIPKNFNGILVGPSLSDQMMDTKKLSNKYDIYNLSMDSGNISELKYAIDNVLKYGNIKIFIICLDPYITKDSGTKSSQINPKEYYSSFGSIFNIKYYLKKLINNRKGENSVFYDSYWGYTDYAYTNKDINSTKRINQSLNEIVKNKDYNINIDKVAYNELQQILSDVRKKDIQVIAYYYPRPKRIIDNIYYQKAYNIYQKKIKQLLNYKNDTIINFSQNKYNYIRDDDSNYSDRIHLSRKGANNIMDILRSKIDK